MPLAIGFKSQRAYRLERSNILLGPVLAGINADGVEEAASTRTGAAQLLSDRLNPHDAWMVVSVGGQSSSAGGYLVQVAHVPQGGTLANAAGWATVGAITFSGTTPNEVGFTGAQAEALVKAAASPAISGKIRVCAIRLVDGTGTGSGQNGVAVPTGTGNLIHIQPT